MKSQNNYKRTNCTTFTKTFERDPLECPIDFLVEKHINDRDYLPYTYYETYPVELPPQEYNYSHRSIHECPKQFGINSCLRVKSSKEAQNKFEEVDSLPSFGGKNEEHKENKSNFQISDVNLRKAKLNTDSESKNNNEMKEALQSKQTKNNLTQPKEGYDKVVTLRTFNESGDQ